MNLLDLLLGQGGTPQGALSQAASAQGTAGPVGSADYQSVLQKMFQQQAAPQTPQGVSPQTTGSVQSPMPQSAPTAAPVSGNGISSLFQGLAGLLNPQAAGKNATINYLTKQGYDPGTAMVIAGDKPLLRQVLVGGKGKNEFDQRAVAAQQYGLQPGSDEYKNFVLSGKLASTDAYRTLSSDEAKSMGLPERGTYQIQPNGHITSIGSGLGGDKPNNYGQSPLVLTDVQGNMHLGQMSNAGGVLIDGKMYSSLPDGWKMGTVSQSGAGGLSPEALDIISTQYLAGDKTAIQGFARNATIRSQIANAIADKANQMGMDGKAIAAEVSAYGGNVSAQKAAGTRAAQVGMAASEADKMADIAVEASRSVPRGSLMPWNAVKNAVATGTSSPEMAAFVTATTSLVNAYARAVSPLGAPTDAMRQHAEQMLNTAQSPQAYEAVINQMKKEMGAALNAPSEISKQLKSQITGAGEQQSGQQSPGAASDFPAGVTEEDMQYTMKAHPEMTRQQILDAIKKAPAR